MSKKIFATNDKNAYAIVDDDVFEIIQKMNLKFCIQPNGYFLSTTKIKLPGMKKKYLYLHRFVWILKSGEEPSSEIDHKDRNKSNNMFENLRLATRQQQNQHQTKRKDNTSGYVGVCHKHQVSKYNNKKYENDYWCTRIMRQDGKNETKLFPYDDTGKIAAAHWYDTKAIEYFGKFHGDLNFPDEIG